MVRSGLILAKANEEIEKKLQSAVFPGNQGGPLVHAIAAKAVCFKEAMTLNIKRINNKWSKMLKPWLKY